MEAPSVEEQLARFRAALPLAPHLAFALRCAGGALLGLAAALATPIPAMFGLFLLVVGFAEREAGGCVAAALSAHAGGGGDEGLLAIAVEPGTDDPIYRALVEGPAGAFWRMTFVPQGWRPSEGRFAARIWRERGTGRPALAILAGGGVVIPRRPATRCARA